VSDGTATLRSVDDESKRRTLRAIKLVVSRP